jgi:hypothetical protein
VRESSRLENIAQKESYDLVKLHLTQTPEKLNSNAVIKIFLHDFARHVRFEEGVIFDAR